MKSDHQWLERWSTHLDERHVLELGCGAGIDTRFIALCTNSVIPCDINLPQNGPAGVPVLRLDHSVDLPFRDSEFDVVVASLCLHYFSQARTKLITHEISRVLKEGGLLICRLNSIRDFNYGARGYAEVEPGLYYVEDQFKKFFSKNEIEELLFHDFSLVNLTEKRIDRYEKEKVVWEFGAINT